MLIKSDPLLDIDECEKPGRCPNGVCQNFIGGYHCRCLNGYRSNRDMTKCFGKLITNWLTVFNTVLFIFCVTVSVAWITMGIVNKYYLIVSQISRHKDYTCSLAKTL